MIASPYRALLFITVAAAIGCGPNVNVDDTTPDCDAIGCTNECPFGFVEDANGCLTCECAPEPVCEDILCNQDCPNGNVLDELGCPTCECLPSDCDGPNPAGCVVNACPPDQVCDTNVGCTPSSCACSNGEWACDDDCGGGTCVPIGAGCEGPNPAGCVSTGCAAGEVCDTELGCTPSGCSCDASSGSWGCTADCGGGICIPDPQGCMDPYPGGCFETGCPLDQMCLMTSGVCVPSVCECVNGGWSCTDDCGGGVCGTP